MHCSLETWSTRMDNLCNISWFMERDIDLWLTEELRVNPVFSRWFLTRIGASDQFAVPALRTQPSVVEETGETDVEAIFKSPQGNTFAALIENKITASFQRDQIARYLRRAKLGVEQGKWHTRRPHIACPACQTGFGRSRLRKPRRRSERTALTRGQSTARRFLSRRRKARSSLLAITIRFEPNGGTRSMQ